MELHALGTGSAFTMKNWQSNFLIRQNGKCLLIDCGGDIRFSLTQAGYTIQDIDAAYVSHLHADHVGGLEWLAFSTLFNQMLKKPLIFGERNLLNELWNKTLVGGLEGLEGTKYTDNIELSTYFDIHPISTNCSFVWQGIKFDIIQSVHVTCKYALSNSFGLMWNDPDTNERTYLTTDCQYSPESSMKAYYNEVDHIFQDCETSSFKSGVHANYADLKTLAPEIKTKMWLYHYQDNVIENFDDWNNNAIADGFRGFIKTGASFVRRYDIQEAGSIGK